MSSDMTRKKELTACLRKEKENIIRQWTQRVVNDPEVPQVEKLSEPALRDHIPEFLDGLAATLESDMNNGEGELHDQPVQRTKAVRQHARLRELFGYTTGEALKELSYLRNVIVSTCFSPENWDAETARTLHTAIDFAMITVVHEIQSYSEEQFRALVESAQDYAIFMINPDGKITSWNPGVGRILGYQEREFIGENSAIIFSAEDRAANVPQEEFKRAVVDGRAIDERWHIRKDGGRFWGDGRVFGLRDKAGRLHGFVKILRDKTKEKLAADQLRESEERFRQLAENISEVFWLLDPEGTHLLYLSPAFEQIWGRSRDELALNPRTIFLEWIVPEDLPKAADFAERLMDGRPLSIEFRIFRMDGEIRWIFDRAFPIKDDSGRLLRIAGIAEDITDRKRVEERLQQERDSSRSEAKQLREDEILRQQELASISHDLRNPIGAAKLALELLQKSLPDTRNIQDMISILRRNLVRAEGLLQNLLDVNRLKAGQKLLLNIRSCDMVQAAREVVDSLQPLYKDRFHLEAAERIVGYWSYSHLVRIIDNLVTNAIKYGTPNSPITIRIQQETETTTITVHNFGPPISPSEQTDLFEPHFRAKSVETTQGWGLGLAFVRGAAEAHGGRVEVTSAPDTGTTFTVTLPNDARPPEHA